MVFPQSERVIYDKNPLIEVICQLRFPPILQIDTEIPAKFQDSVRKAYPHYKDKKQFDLPLDAPPVIAKLAMDLAIHQAGSVYEFTSLDRSWVVGLSRDFLSLTTTKYDRWENYLEHLQLPLQALQEIYEPSYYSRIGLRYRNVIQRSKLGLDDVDWSELLRPHIVAELVRPEISERLEQVSKELLMRLDEYDGKVRMKYGLAKDTERNEPCYVIDNDFFTNQETEKKDDAITKLDYFHRLSGGLFRWCISEELHGAMGPTGI